MATFGLGKSSIGSTAAGSLSSNAQVAFGAPRQLLALLAVAVGLNYIDRGTLAVAGPLLVDGLRLTATQFGVLLSAFFWSYVAMQVPAGWLADRYGGARVLTLAVALWSMTTALTSLAATFGALLALRMVLGVGESAFFPCSSKLIAGTIPLERRASANSVIMFGLALGPAIGTAVGAKLMAAFGWRATFAVFGFVSLLWLIPWSRMRRSLMAIARDDSRKGPASPSLVELLRHRSLWGASLGHLSLNYGFTFMLSWMPLYLVKARGFSLTAMGAIAGAAYLLNGLAAVASGWAIDRSVRRGVSLNRAYKLVMASNHVGAMLVTIAVVFSGPKIAIACLWIYQLLSGMVGLGVFAIGQILAGPRAAARWIGVQGTVANIAGLTSPIITGLLVDASGSFAPAFVFAASVNVLGLFGWLVLVQRIEPIAWASARPLQPG
jgi:MFS family permease